MKVSPNLKSLQVAHESGVSFLGVGPVTKNTVDATIELAQMSTVPIFLIASRRQIDSAAVGGGYVNGWSTETFCEYVKSRDHGQKIIIARDHGGPWQNTFEIEQAFSIDQAMESAKLSFKTDIESGFGKIHIDPSVEPGLDSPDIDVVLRRCFELYGFCQEVSLSQNKALIYEIGTDAQGDDFHNLDELKHVLNSFMQFCKKTGFKMPHFIVAQTGTHILETENVGKLPPWLQEYSEKDSGATAAPLQVPKELKAAIEFCNRSGVWLKAHNMDYLKPWMLSRLNRAGLHSANIAPEYGVTESRRFFELLNEHELNDIASDWIELAYNSGKWKKWMKPGSVASRTEKAIIAGHYVLATAEFSRIKHRAEEVLTKKGVHLEAALKSAIKDLLLDHLNAFGILKDKSRVLSAA
jgi:hypothetical protein